MTYKTDSNGVIIEPGLYDGKVVKVELVGSDIELTINQSLTVVVIVMRLVDPSWVCLNEFAHQSSICTVEVTECAFEERRHIEDWYDRHPHLGAPLSKRGFKQREEFVELAFKENRLFISIDASIGLYGFASVERIEFLELGQS